MREHERESARDDAFEALLAQSVDELPPEEIVADVTPWRSACCSVWRCAWSP